MLRPLLAITMGDPAGIGPEIIAQSWSDALAHKLSRRVVIGCPLVMREALRIVGAHVEVVEIDDVTEASDDPQRMSVLKIKTPAHQATKCQVSAVAGKAAAEAVLLATDLALAGKISGIVTAPLNKESLRAAGVQVPGHTELLAERCGVQNVAMMLYLPPAPNLVGEIGLGVVHVTLHTALRNVFEELSQFAIVEKCHLATQFSRAMLQASQINREPRIGVAALNPHGGENGLFGDEEIRIIAPAVIVAAAEGCPVVGPLPCDTLMHRAASGEFDSVVAMYHDQGHIALKLLGLQQAVNVTLGLPIIRTSVAHGTAFDIAWQGKAGSGSLLQALKVAANLANQRETG
jgi:4-phospho-D-threonate 3-dehydrogenase / 4-phospho-D-erythronate 3-dehydrogenase